MSRTKAPMASQKKRPVGLSDTEADTLRVAMSQVLATAAKGEKHMQSIVETYRRSGNTAPLWLSTMPYYKKDSMLVINLRDEHIVLPSLGDIDEVVPHTKVPDIDMKSHHRPPQPVVKDRAPPSQFVQPAIQSFAVSGGDAASRLGLRIGAAAEPTHVTRKDVDAIESAIQPEMTIMRNVRNLVPSSGAAWDSAGLDNLLVGAAPVDPLTINSDPLWGADTSASATSDHELQTMLSVLKDLAPVNLETASVPRDIGMRPESHFQTAPAAASTSHLQQQLTQPSPNPQTNSQNSPQFYYFMSPEGVHMMAPVPVQSGLSYMPYQHNHHQQPQQLGQHLSQGSTLQTPYVSHQIIAQQQQQQYFALAAQMQQQQQAASQQQAALAALQLSKGTVAKAAAPKDSLKSPNPNARPFQPHESKFNVEAIPFVPPTGR